MKRIATNQVKGPQVHLRLVALFKHWALFALLGSLLLIGCRPVDCTIEPTIVLTPSPAPFDCLQSPFPRLSEDELKTDWGKELLIGNQFAKEFDLYRAITAYKRALVLIPEDEPRVLQINYNIIRCYYLGEKSKEAIETFESSPLTHVTGNFPAIGDLLIMLYDAYQNDGQCRKAERVLEVIEKGNPPAAESLILGEAILEADFCQLNEATNSERFGPEINLLLHEYCTNKKSVNQAQTLAAILPGAGYWYVGQKKSALTSFIINALFIAAAYECFDHGYPAAGLIVTSLEIGWYYGGINGSGLAAKQINENLYQNLAKQTMVKSRLFPLLLLETTF